MTKNHRSALPPIPKKMGTSRQGFGGAGGGKGIGPTKPADAKAVSADKDPSAGNAQEHTTKRTLYFSKTH